MILFQRFRFLLFFSLRALCPLWLTGLVFFGPASNSALGASEEEWKLIGRSRTETLWFVDTKTLSRSSDNIVSVWLKTVPAKTDTEFSEGNESVEVILKKIQARNFGDYEYTEALWELDCLSGMFRVLYFAAFDRQDNVITSSLTPDPEWSCVIAGGVAETMLESLCGH